VLQLILDLWMLYGTCRRTEGWWGWERTLAIFLLAGFCGNCVQLAQSVGYVQQGQLVLQPVLGGWDAICGLIAAEAVWMLLSRKHLPRSSVRNWRRGFIGTAILLIFMGMFPGAGSWGLLGGAATGALAGLCLYWQRFGPDPWRWLGFLAVVPLPWLGYALIDRAKQTDPIWAKLVKQEEAREEKEFEDSKLPGRLGGVIKSSENWYDVKFAPMLRRDGDNWKARDPAEVKEVLAALAELRKRMEQLSADLRSSRRSYRSPDILKTIDRAQVYLQTRTKQLNLAEQLLRDRDQITQEDRDQLKRLRAEVDERRQEWE
jgi:hypothetical protein